MNRTKWLKENSIKLNEQYYTRVLGDYNFKLNKDYTVTCNRTGDCDICLKNNGKSYRIEIDEETEGFKLLNENFVFNPSRKSRHHHIKKIFNNIFEVLDFIKGTRFKKAS